MTRKKQTIRPGRSRTSVGEPVLVDQALLSRVHTALADSCDPNSELSELTDRSRTDKSEMRVFENPGKVCENI